MSLCLSPGGTVPYSNLYAQLNGLQLCVDPASVLWVNTFSRGLLRTLDQVKAFYHLQDSSKSDEHVDLRMDAAQLKVITAFLEIHRRNLKSVYILYILYYVNYTIKYIFAVFYLKDSVIYLLLFATCPSCEMKHGPDLL